MQILRLFCMCLSNVCSLKADTGNGNSKCITTFIIMTKKRSFRFLILGLAYSLRNKIGMFSVISLRSLEAVFFFLLPLDLTY